MNPVHTRLEIGLEKPLRFLHVTDSHIALADERDDERKRVLARERAIAFDAADPDRPRREFAAMLDYSRDNCDLMLHTGDLIDFVSYPNLELARQTLSAETCFFAVGNHEFSKYVGEAWEDEAYKLDSLPLVAPVFPNDLRFASRRIGGINLVAIDNSYYLFRRKELDLFKREVERNLPILLLLHNPIHTDELYREMMEHRRTGCAYLAGSPEEKLVCYDEQRRRQQRPDGETMEFIHYLERQTAVFAILAGHLHFNFESALPCGIPQYITGGGFRGDAREIEVV